jgi:Tol biopolymer transport system component
VRTLATTRKTEGRGKRRSALLFGLGFGVALAGVVALAGAAREAEATFPGTNGKLLFISTRTTGTGVDNPTGDPEIFSINPDGTGLRQLTNNTVNDEEPVLSPDGKKVAYSSQGDAISNPGGHQEVYLMNAADGSDKKNLTNNAARDYYAEWGR